MTNDEVAVFAEEIARKYNSGGLSPFPFEKIVKENKDIVIYVVDEEVLPEDISGAVSYEKKDKRFQIFINQKKPKTRQYFTIAHELGHYFLHKDFIQEEEVVIDGESFLDIPGMLLRFDEVSTTRRETEANIFAASLLMPQHLIKKAWDALHDVEESAKIFNVSVSAMSIRLERLGFLPT